MDEFPAYEERDHDSSRSIDIIIAARRFRRNSSSDPSTNEVEVIRSRDYSLSRLERSNIGLDSQTSEWNSQASTPRPVSYDGRPRHISLQYHCDKAVSESLLPESSQTLSSHPLIDHAAPPAPPPAPTTSQEIHFSTIHEIAFIATICFSQFLSLASLAQTVAPLLIIGDSLGVTNPAQLAWFTASYSMSLGTFIMPAGRIGDIIGHKKVYLIGWIWLAFSALVAGFSFVSGPIMFSVCRALQGIGPALLLPNAMAIVGRTYPVGLKRNIVFSLFGACGPTGFFFGALFSALIAQLAYWPWAFWALTCVALTVCVAAYFAIPAALSQPVRPGGARPPPFDFLGALTGVSGLLLVNFALNQAPLVGWGTPYVYFTLAMGALQLAHFVLIEARVAAAPLVPVRGLHPQAGFALAVIAAGWASHGVWSYYLFLFALRVRGATAVGAAAQMLPVAVTGPAFALSTGFLLRKVHVSVVLMIAMVVFLGGTALLAFAPASQPYWGLTFVSVLVMPAAMNLSFPAGTIILSNLMPKSEQGKAASLVSTVVNYSIATGLGLAGSIERYAKDVGKSEVEGYRWAWYLGMGLSGIGVLLSVYFFVLSRLEKRKREEREKV